MQVYIVTGSSAGIGKELVKMLYSKHARIYMAARSEERVNRAIAEIKTFAPDSKGSLCL